MRSDYIDVPFYLHVHPEAHWTDGTVAEARATKVTTRRTKPVDGTVVLHLTARIPVSAFEPLTAPVVVVPEQGAVAVVTSGGGS